MQSSRQTQAYPNQPGQQAGATNGNRYQQHQFQDSAPPSQPVPPGNAALRASGGYQQQWQGGAPPAQAPPPQEQPQQQPNAAGNQNQAQQQAPTPAAAPKSNPNSTQNTLQIAEIRDGVVIMNDGTFRSVIMARSINFDLMSQNEQEAVEYGYQGFLNSLYFPMQIFMRSQKVDLNPYIEKLDKIRSEHDNMLLALLMEDYIGYIDALAQQTNIMDKKFYIVVPYAPTAAGEKLLSDGGSKSFATGLAGLFTSKDQHVVINEKTLEDAKVELRNRVQAILGGLVQTGVKALPLDTQELIELYYDFYNPDTATRQPLKNFDNLSADIITKGEGRAVQPHMQRELQ
jgi:hypothetical protein